METIKKETYNLPIFENQPIEFTISSNRDGTDGNRPDPEMHDGKLHIKETIAESGKRTISVIHSIEGEIAARYRFDIASYDRRLCRYAGEDTPPWSVFYAVTEYGYRCETAPEPTRKHIFGHLVAGNAELAQHVLDQEYEYSVGIGKLIVEILYCYAQVAAVEEQVGPNRMEEFVSLMPSGPRRFVTDDILSGLAEMNIEDPYVPVPLAHPSVDSLANQMKGDESEKEPDKSEDGSSASESPGYMIIRHRGRGEYQNEIYVSLIGSDAIDQSSFEITDEEKGQCVAQTNIKGDIPPFIVLDSLREDFEIKNVPLFSYDESTQLTDVLIDVDRLTRRITSQFPPEYSGVKNVLDKYICTIDAYLAVAVAYDFAPSQYNHTIKQIFSKLDIELASQEIQTLDPTRINKISATGFQGIKNVEEIAKSGRDLDEATRIKNRYPTEHDNLPDIPLLSRIYDPNTCINN